MRVTGGIKINIRKPLTLVSFPDPTTHTRKGSEDIGADSWFCKLTESAITCMV
jgi:hypothetical protein